MKLSILLISIINFGCQNDLKKKTKQILSNSNSSSTRLISFFDYSSQSRFIQHHGNFSFHRVAIVIREELPYKRNFNLSEDDYSEIEFASLFHFSNWMILIENLGKDLFEL